MMELQLIFLSGRLALNRVTIHHYFLPDSLLPCFQQSITILQPVPNYTAGNMSMSV